METNKHACPNRCELSFDYDWQHTNLNLALIKGDIEYFLNGGDKISIEVDKITPKSVYVLFNGNTQELTNNNNTWSGNIPTKWNSNGVFSVIADYNGCKILLYQGLLNQTESFTSIDTANQNIYSSDETINVKRTNDGYDITLYQYMVSEKYELKNGELTIEDDDLFNAINYKALQTIVFANLDGSTMFFRLSEIKDNIYCYVCIGYISNNIFVLMTTADGKIVIKVPE